MEGIINRIQVINSSGANGGSGSQETINYNSCATVGWDFMWIDPFTIENEGIVFGVSEVLSNES